MTTKRTIDADKLHELLLTTCAKAFKPGQWEPVSDAIDAAFPIADRSNGVTVVYQDEEHFIPQAVFDVLKERFKEAPASPTHNLRPLPESEWPEELKEYLDDLGHEIAEYYGRLDEDHHLTRTLTFVDTPNDRMWDVRRSNGFIVGGEGCPTPAAALEAAGLPVELLDGLERRNVSDGDGSSEVGSGLDGMKNDRNHSKTPAYENPRVVTAAVEMVKEVEQHTAKAAKDREDWLAQFPGWVREYFDSRLDDARPLRMVSEMCLMYRPDWHVFRVMRPSTINPSLLSQFDSGSDLVALANRLDLPLYADGSVPLWGDVITHLNQLRPERRVNGINIDGSISLDRRLWCEERPSDYCLLRRHPAIADLPGIVVDRNQPDKPDTESPDRSTDRPMPKLRVGQRVRHQATKTLSATGRIVEFLDNDSSRVRVWIDGYGDRVLHIDDLTPIPPPLIDHGDGTWTMEGYGMFVIRSSSGGGGARWELHPISDTWRDWEKAAWIGPWEANCDNPVEAAAEDLWRRMEGVG